MKVILTKDQMRLIKTNYPQPIKPVVKGYNFVLSDLFEQLMDEAVKAKSSPYR